jgi:uncharacterized protein YjbI with pentapeptide repeats
MQSDELSQMLQSHQLWLKSGGKEGQQARLEDFNLGVVADFSDLSGADLRDAILNRAEFKDADLTETNFQGAELRRASFDGAILRGTNLRETDLQNANLENAEFLLTAQLAGSNVAGAKLPKPIAEFEGLKTIAEATSNAQKLFVAMLGGCLYSWLTIGTTKDVALLTNSASSPLPIIGTALPIVGFYTVAPIVLLAMYFYFHLNMQRLWEALADLPAVFPDGRSLDKRADPWLLNGLVSAHFVRLRRQRPALSRVQQWLSILLAWWVVPVTVFVFWGRFLPCHDWSGTLLHVWLLAIATGFGWMSYRLACRTLRGARRRPFRWTQPWKHGRTLMRTVGLLGTCGVGVVLYFFSFGAIEGLPHDKMFSVERPDVGRYSPRSFAPRFLALLGFRTYADLVEEEISIRPLNWDESQGEYRTVKGATLDRANMQYAFAADAFLVNAKLFGADLNNALLDGANLSNADLRHANLKGADLRGARLNKAKLEWAKLPGAELVSAFLISANLSGCDLTDAILVTANLSEANLSDANLTKANLTEAKLNGADLTNANLDFAILRGTDLRAVKGLTQTQIQNAIGDDKTLLPSDMHIVPRP